MAKRYKVKLRLETGFVGADHEFEFYLSADEREKYLSLPEEERDEWVFEKHGRGWAWECIEVYCQVEEEEV